MQFDKEASQTRDYCVAKSATHRAARPDPSLRKERLLRMTSKLHHYQKSGAPHKFQICHENQKQGQRRRTGVSDPHDLWWPLDSVWALTD